MSSVAKTDPSSPQTMRVMPWLERLSVLWMHRRNLMRIAVVSFFASLLISVVIPKQYKASASIMPPSNAGASSAMLAAVTGRALGGMGGLGSLAGSLLGIGNSTALFLDLLHSGTVTGHIIDRFDLRRVYRKRYKVDAAKALAKHTSIQDDKKSGVITITVEDRDPQRARDMAQAYLDELNLLVNRTNTSSAHQERIFVQKRLVQAKTDLQRAQQDLSDFSSRTSTIDLKEQARALVGSAAQLQAQVLQEDSNISSLRQVYGDGNVRLRAAKARVASLRSELSKMNGVGMLEAGEDEEASVSGRLSPPLRQLPRLAVPFANRYREVQVQEKLFELLTEQLEMARISEAKDVPVVSVIDAPGIAEKKSYPPRALLTLGLWLATMIAACTAVLLCHAWRSIDADDPRRVFASDISSRLLRRGGA
ncbi:capsule polysaccharide export protein [Terriglobus roseus DSM 18391]|uniref:Capsule polysaccharide export protein n=1 Tax=Terriglobus roseus (strain DSM 18391 / NRRL B-41598 / KBS 63) TaxID=926566 RepID=I3ZE38_TERRK|nr:LPS biosynthesis protein [Terriglobus roseus]AFL87506.1 capsule polysaccharide export protein [Terriglobus roseus DSM 18391]